MFNKGVTAIVGPNGSGKSNIADAIQWVLGEQSLKVLRGQKAEDIIFSGTDKRRPLHFAQVSIKFDNEDGALPVKFPEVEVTRRVFRHGENEYLMNGQQVRLKDVRQLFMDTGFGKDGYAIVGQGQIDAILSESAKDRKHLFDEAAGISRVKYEKEESRRNLERLSQQLVRIGDMHHATERFVEQLRVESEKAKNYLKLFQETKEAVAQHTYRRVQVLMKRMEEYQLTIGRIDEAVEEAMRDRQSLMEVIRLGEDRLTQKEETKKALLVTYHNKTSEVEQLRGRQNLAMAEQLRLEKEHKQLAKKLLELRERYSMWQRDEEKTSLDEEGAASLEVQKASLESLQRELSEKETWLKTQQEKLKSVQAKAREAMEAALKQKMDLEWSLKREAELRRELIAIEETEAGIQNDLLKQRELITQKQALLSQNDDELHEAELLLQENAHNKAALQESLHQCKEQLLKLRGELAVLQAKLGVLGRAREQYENYGKSVQELMQAIRKEDYGIHNTLAEVIHVDEVYAKALETALGFSMQNIIIEKAERIKDLINLAKRNRWGRVTFLPLDTIKAKKVMTPKCLPEGCKGLAIDLIRVDTVYHEVLAHLLRNTLVFDNYANALTFARAVGFDRKIVTIQGEIIFSGGAVSIGESKQKSSILGEKQRWEKLAEEELQTVSAVEHEESKLQAFQESLDQYDAVIPELDKAVEDLKRNAQSISQLIWEEQLTKEKRERELAENQKHRETLEHELRCLVHPSVAEEEAATDDLTVRLEKAIATTQEEMQGIRRQIAKEQEAYYCAREAVQARHFAREQYLAEGERLSDDRQQVEKMLEAAIQNEAVNRADKETAQIALNEAEKDYASCREDLSAIEDYIYAERIRQKEMQEKIRDIDELKHSRALERVGWENKLESMRVEKDRLVLHVKEAYDLRLEDWKDIGKDVSRREIREMEAALQNVGTVNVSSIHQYELERERFDELKAQREDLIQSKKKLEALIEKMEAEMEERFTESLSSINDNFNRVFSRLFNGGRAELIYRQEDGEDMVHILVEPPGKKLQHLNLLSGGEKALTAVALIFALLHERPSPFSILDEIDAALDEANIARYTDYIRLLSHETQFVMITHRHGTMELAETIYGVTMEQKGISKVIPLEVKEYL